MADRVSIESFTFQYPGTEHPALRDLSLDFPARSCSVLLGPTGAGKSTLLHALSGVLGSEFKGARAEGSIVIGSEHHRPLPGSPLFPRVGLFLQDPTVQISGLRETVEDEIRFSLDNLQVPEEEAHSRVLDQLRDLGLTGLEHRDIRQLSGGELQRVALAGALVSSPSVLLMDEPFNSLDASGQAQLIGLLSLLKQRTTIVVSDYQIDAALRFADRVVVLDQGSVLYQGAPAGFIRRASEFIDILPTDRLVRIASLLADYPGSGHGRRIVTNLMASE
jgi:energy-coupling factor transporter ATP-binding protein EcfA2